MNQRAESIYTRVARGIPGAGAGTMAWNARVASLSPWAWLKLDDATTGLVAADSSGNARDASYPNGDFGGGSHPVRHSAALVAGSTWGIVTAGTGSDELRGTNYGNAMSGSWTFGMAIKSSSTTAAEYLMGQSIANLYNMSVSLNFNFVTGLAAAGAISMSYDTEGVRANGLAATATGWNNGSAHWMMFEYNSVANTISIWLDGTRIATRTRAGTKPTMTNLSINFLRVNPIASMGMDEVLFFDKVLSQSDHTILAGYHV